jgi:omega-6 fatty acid desaturase (delta-12 desaturase)
MYSEYDIIKITETLKKYHATEFQTPILSLLISLLFIILSVTYIHISKTSFDWTLGICLLSLSLLRMFMIFHDLCHKSFFPSDERKTKTRKINYHFAEFIEFIHFFNADGWEKGHSSHHHAHGNLNLKDNSRFVITDSEYNKLPPYQQYLYTIFRQPLLFFLLIPIYIFWINRFLYFEWFYLLKYFTFLFILYTIGNWRLVFSFIFAQYLTGIMGVCLFHLQHQVNTGFLHHFDVNDTIMKDNAELLGASVLTIPCGFDIFTNGIEYHNIHHIDPGVPSYNIRQAYEDLVKDGSIPDTKIGYLHAISSLFHTRYDDINGIYY